MNQTFGLINLGASLQFLEGLSFVWTLVIVDAPEPGNKDVLFVEETQVVVQVVFLETFHKEQVGKWYKNKLCARTKCGHHFLNFKIKKNLKIIIY